VHHLAAYLKIKFQFSEGALWWGYGRCQWGSSHLWCEATTPHNETDKAHPQLPNADSVSTLELQQQLWLMHGHCCEYSSHRHQCTWTCMRVQCHRASIPGLGHCVVLPKCIYPYLFSLAPSSFPSVFYKETENTSIVCSTVRTRSLATSTPKLFILQQIMSRVAHGSGTGPCGPTRTHTRKTQTHTWNICGFDKTPQVPENPYRYFNKFSFWEHLCCFLAVCFVLHVMFLYCTNMKSCRYVV